MLTTSRGGRAVHEELGRGGVEGAGRLHRCRAKVMPVKLATWPSSRSGSPGWPPRSAGLAPLQPAACMHARQLPKHSPAQPGPARLT